MNVLYISYDGILEPLGQSQVLSYLEGLTNERVIHLISFEKPADKKNQRLYNKVSQRIENANIQWHPLTYHKQPTAIATLWDIFRAIILGLWLVLRFKLRIIHARSYVSSVAALAIKKLLGTYYIFDMRGFWVDERVDGGIWDKDSYLFRISKLLEKSFLLNADRIVSLTDAAVVEIKTFPYLINKSLNFEVIPTCTNLNLFKPSDGNYDSNSPFVLGYVGSVGVWYLFNEVLLCYKYIQEILPNAKLHIVNKGGHDYIHNCILNANIDYNNVTIEELDSAGVANAVKTMNAGIFFYKATFARKATSPTRLGEFLGCGIPCMSNSGIGDIDKTLNQENVGVVLDGFDEERIRKGVFDLLKLSNDPDVKKRCRIVAKKYFSLSDGINSYNKIYHSFGEKF